MLWYLFPSNHFRVIAVTGTNGKTTVTNLIAKILSSSGQKVGLISTIAFQINDRIWENHSKKTTPDAFALQKLLNQMKKAGCETVVLETSSHAVTQGRINGINIDTAVLTNITQDHFDFHGNFTKYREAKAELFRHLNRSTRKPSLPKISILPREDPNFAYFNILPTDQKYTFGTNKGCTLSAVDIQTNAHGSSFILKAINEKISVHLNLPGMFNVYNTLAAASASLAAGASLQQIKAALEKISPFPGRTETINEGQNFAVIVDFAHTPDALENILKTFKPLTKGKLWLVFGATGERDRQKRPLMGQIADKLADEIILTNDDTYYEDELDIANEVAGGITRCEGQHFWIILDRFEAIRYAIFHAQENDTIILAGKGCETVQVLGAEWKPWDDREVARRILRSRK